MPESRGASGARRGYQGWCQGGQESRNVFAMFVGLLRSGRCAPNFRNDTVNVQPRSHRLRRPDAWLLLCFLVACGDRTDTGDAARQLPEPTFVGSAACADCHADEYTRWLGSHHDDAMKPANDDTVLGDFDDAGHVYFGTESEFFRRDGGYWIRTADADGEAAEFRVAYTFGVYPLQQYLIEFPGGRLQASSLAWDSRPAEAGGQRWFHLYPDEYIAPDDPLHWTGSEQNWNYMCAECHSTNLVKNFDRRSRTFDTTWSEINVGCEGCHGPASRHVAMAQGDAVDRDTGLVVSLDDAGGAVWVMDPDTGIASRSEPRLSPPRQPDACGRCHARRSQLVDGYEYGRDLLDTHRPALLDDGLYHPDGQIRDEVYVWGSFLQSRMYRAGVSCTDCHDPHTAALRTNGPASNVCATCHLPARFATVEHHGHPGGEPACVDCHMASRDYMVIDGRRDHSFRIPRPDLTVSTGSPNACGNCHEDQGPEWSDAIVRNWHGPDRSRHYADAIHAGRTGRAGANLELASAATNRDFPGIARGTALSLLSWPLDAASAAAIRDGLESADGIVRLGALRALASAPADFRLRWATPLLEDPLLAVRVEATGVLLPLRDRIPAASSAAFAAAERDYVAAQLANAERPEAYANLAAVFLARGDVGRAEQAYQTALSIEPRAVAARVNLVDLYRQRDRDDDGRALLRAGIDLDADNAALRHALGLLLVRQQELQPALAELERAAELDPGNSRYAYVLAVAVGSTGQAERAIALLEQARRAFPGDFDIGWALVTTLRDGGRAEDARAAARALRRQFPDNPDVAVLLDSITDRAPADPDR